MTVKQLIERLQELDPNLEVAILDGFNGGGQPRTINLGPQVDKTETMYNRRDYADIETEQDAPIVIMGYGCY